MKLINRFLQAVALDESHRVVRSPVVVLTESVHGHDAGMFESAGDFGFQHEPTAAVWVVGELILNFLQRDFAVELLIASDKHFAQPAPSVRPQDAKSRIRRVI